MRKVLHRRTATPVQQQEWEDELAAFGITNDKSELDEDAIVIYEENLEVINWWLAIPIFLKFNQYAAIGMDVLAVKADAEMSDRKYTTQDYAKLKVIAKIAAEEVNKNE